MKKIALFLIMIVLLSGCNKKSELNDFQKLYDVDSSLVETISFTDFKELTKSKTGIVFIGDDTNESKETAQIFVNNLCECDVNKAHFINKDDVNEEELKELLDIKELSYPIIVAYKVGEQTGFYDLKSKTEDVNDYIYNLILSAYPTVCTDAC